MLHDYWLWFDTFGWATLLFAHYWNWTRQRHGGLPWVLSTLWLSTYVMALNTAAFAAEEWLLGHHWVVAGINWPHLIQVGASVTFLALGVQVVAKALGLPIMDPAWLIGHRLAVAPWRAYAYGHVFTVAVGLSLVAVVALGGLAFGVWPNGVALEELHCE
ncbi:MAG: hypothetical protein HY688_00775 [Chloroflexi bacterium]|nr:hypothetical protein [Chloroflexota bacterium]